MITDRKISRRELLRGAAALAGAALLSACAPSTPGTETTTGDDVSSAPPAVEQANLKLALWGSAEYVKAWEGMIEVYEEQSDNVTVEVMALPSGDEFYQKVQVMLAGNSPLDVFIVEDKMTRFFASNGVIIPIDEFVDASDTDKYYASTVDPFKWEGKLYGLPRRVNNTAVYYSKAMFDEAGLDYPVEGWSQNDFLDMAQALTQKSGDETQVYGSDFLLVYQHIVPWIWSNGGELFKEDFSESTVTMPEVVDTLQFVADLRFKYGVMATQEVSDAMEGMGGMFMSKKLAMSGGGYGCWMVPTFRQIEDFEWDVAPLPKGSVSKTNIVYASCFAVSQHSAYPSQAVDFVLFSTGPVAQAKESENPTAIPSLIEVAESDAFIDPTKPPEHMDQFLKELEVGRPAADVYPPTTFAECSQAFTEELDPLWLGKQSAEESCNSLKARLDQILADAAQA